MDALLGLIGNALARTYAYYGLVCLVLPAFLFADLLLLAVVIYAVASHARGRQPWPRLPPALRRWARLTVEVSFGPELLQATKASLQILRSPDARAA